MSNQHISIPTLSEKDIKRFWSKVNILEDKNLCWLWIPRTSPNKLHGEFRIESKNYTSHRIAYFLHYGIDPGKLVVCHTCDCRKCCNPNHLFLGTQKDNMVDMVSKNRQAKGLNHGCYKHPETLRKGELNGRAKLTESLVLHIRHLKETQNIPTRKLARDFGVHQGTMIDLLRRKTWKHI